MNKTVSHNNESYEKIGIILHEYFFSKYLHGPYMYERLEFSISHTTVHSLSEWSWLTLLVQALSWIFCKQPTLHPTFQKINSSENVTKKLVCRKIRDSYLLLSLTLSWTGDNLDWYNNMIHIVFYYLDLSVAVVESSLLVSM